LQVLDIISVYGGESWWCIVGLVGRHLCQCLHQTKLFGDGSDDQILIGDLFSKVFDGGVVLHEYQRVGDVHG
jgi:hypothetical protein